jgi:tRNA 2-selenouridine synthase
MVKMVEEVEKLCAAKQDKTILVHCWRGGMRSSAVAWLLDMYGFKVYTLDGGYKAFRNWVLLQFQISYTFKIVGGYTGSGKTELLAEMKRRGEKVIDLEALANHKGSAFGSIGQGVQPSPEMFENNLAVELMKAVDRCEMTDDRSEKDERWQMSGDRIKEEQNTEQHQPSTQTIWFEDESQRIGNINIPIELWKTMRSKPVIFLNIPFEERLENIVKNYGKDDKDKLINAIIRIKKRLGGLEAKAAINLLLEDNLKESFRILLTYYDKWYRKGLESRDNWKELVTEINADTVDAALNAQLVLASKRNEQNV